MHAEFICSKIEQKSPDINDASDYIVISVRKLARELVSTTLQLDKINSIAMDV